MKTAITTCLLLCSIWSFGQYDVYKARDQILNSSLLKQTLNTNKVKKGLKALQFDEAYTTLTFDTANAKWDSVSRSTNFMDPLPNVAHKVAISLYGEEYNGQFWKPSDSGYAVMDTSYNRFKVPSEYVFDTLKSFAWDSANASWVLFLENRMTVNANKDITAYETFINLQALGVPIPGMQAFARTDFYYDAQNVLEYWVTKEFSFGVGLQNADSVIVTANANGYRATDEVYKWNGSNWDKDEKFTYLYNANDELIEEIYQSYDASSQSYINSNKNVYIYDAQGNVTIDSAFVSNGNWVLNRIHTENYSSFGERLNQKDFAIGSNNLPYIFSEANYYYNNNNQRDSVVWQSRYTHNPNTPLLFEEKEIYRFSPFTNNGGSTSGVPTAPSNLTVIAGRKSGLKMSLTWTDNSTNENGFLIERSLDSLNWTSIDSAAANSVSFDDSTILGNTKYYYRIAAFNNNGSSSYSNSASGISLTVGLVEHASFGFKFYPNPAKEHIRFNEALKSELLIYNTSGTLVIKQLKGSQQLNLSSIKKGLYIIKYNNSSYKLIKH